MSVFLQCPSDALHVFDPEIVALDDFFEREFRHLLEVNRVERDVGVEARAGDHAGLLDALRDLRARAIRPPALISGNAVVTMRIVAAVAELGWRLGADIGLIGIDDTPWAPYVGPGISALAQPTDALGNLAAQCLIERIAGLDAPPRAIRLPGALMARGSTRLD